MKTPKRIHPRTGFDSPKESPVPSVLNLSSTRASAGKAENKLAAAVTPATFETSDFSALQTTLKVFKAGTPDEYHKKQDVTTRTNLECRIDSEMFLVPCTLLTALNLELFEALRVVPVTNLEVEIAATEAIFC